MRRLKRLLSPRMKRAVATLAYAAAWPRDAVFCAIWGLPWHHSWRFRRLPRVKTRTRGSIRIGRGFSANSDWRHNAVGIFQPVTLQTVTYEAKIEIGRNVGISGSTVAAAERIVIEDDVMIGSGCIIADSDFHPLAYEDREHTERTVNRPVHIGAGAFIGARSIVLKGVTIGRGAVIGAGSVVTRDVPAGMIAAGNPARVVRPL